MDGRTSVIHLSPTADMQKQDNRFLLSDLSQQPIIAYTVPPSSTLISRQSPAVLSWIFTVF